MTQVSTQSRGAAASVLNMVGQTANMVTDLVTVGSDSIGMLNSAVSLASQKQAMKHKVDKFQYKTNLIRETAAMNAQATLEIAEFCAQSEHHKSVYLEFEKELQELLS